MRAPDAYLVARKLGQRAPGPDFVEECQDALDGAVADVEGYLGRPITPRRYVEHGLWPHPEGWKLQEDPVIAVVQATAETFEGQLTGAFTVEYEAGLDWRSHPDMDPVRRYILAAAINDPVLTESVRLSRADSGAAVGPVKSVTTSTEGQSRSVTFDAGKGYGGGGSAGADSPGALPSKATMDRWRRANRRVYQPPAVDYPRW